MKVPSCKISAFQMQKYCQQNSLIHRKAERLCQTWDMIVSDLELRYVLGALRCIVTFSLECDLDAMFQPLSWTGASFCSRGLTPSGKTMSKKL